MDDFLKENYHTHTTRCQHAFGTEREYIEAAIDMEIKVLGFSDHIPCPYHTDFVSGIRMRMEEAREYADVVRTLGKEYKNDIKILLGFEAEYIPEFYEEQRKMMYDLNCDYVILGQHFLQSEEYGPYTGTPTNDPERLKEYVDTVLEGMRTGTYLYLAHPDLVNFTGLDSVYEYEMRRLCTVLKDLEMPLEINALGMATHRHYPCERFWKIAGEVGNDVVIGLDAHAPKQLKDYDAYEACMQLVRSCGLHLKTHLDRRWK